MVVRLCLPMRIRQHLYDRTKILCCQVAISLKQIPKLSRPAFARKFGCHQGYQLALVYHSSLCERILELLKKFGPQDPGQIVVAEDKRKYPTCMGGANETASIVEFVSCQLVRKSLR